MKQSSIEWLMEIDKSSSITMEEWQQAKAMHKYEIKEAFLIPYTGTADEYYELTYGGNK